MRKEFLVYGSSAIEQVESEEIVGVMQTRWLGTDSRFAHFEQRFIKHKSMGYTLAIRRPFC